MNEVDLGFNIKADINQNNTTIHLTEGKRKLAPKVVDTKDFINTISSLKEIENVRESPLLPGDYGTKKTYQVGNNHYFLMTTEGRVRTIKYSPLEYVDILVEDEYDDWVNYYDLDDSAEVLDDFFSSNGFHRDESFELDVYTPDTVWMVHVRKNDENDNYYLVNTQVYGMTSMMLSMDDVLYPYPLPNVYQSNKVCWGYSELPDLTIQGLLAVERIFYNNEFNTDLDAVNTSPVAIDDYIYKGKTMLLVKNNNILLTQGESDARDNINNLMKASIYRKDTIEEVWHEFTQSNNR